ncbi:hypothetical protein U2F10_02830 [Leptothoe sp. EHU-05/26/07-4]
MFSSITTPFIPTCLTSTQRLYLADRAEGLTQRQIATKHWISDESLVSQVCHRACNRVGAASVPQLLYWMGQDIPSSLPPIVVGPRRGLVLALLSKGLLPKQVAKRLGISEVCTHFHLRAVREQTSSQNMYQMMYVIGQRGVQIGELLRAEEVLTLRASEISEAEKELLEQLALSRKAMTWSDGRSDTARLIRQLCDSQGFEPEFAHTAHNERVDFCRQRYGELFMSV